MTDHTSDNAYPQPPAPPPVVAPPPYVPTPAPTRKRKGPPWWVWLIIGCVVLAVLVVGSAVLTFVGQRTKAFSPDYVGAPVEASDAVGTTKVSKDATVAYEQPAAWVDVQDYVDLSAFTVGLPDAIWIDGAHFTSEPGVTVPQLVVIYEGEPQESMSRGLRAELNSFVAGVADSGVDVEVSEPEAYSTANGLEGYSVDYSGVVEGIDTQNTAIMLGHGRRIVIVQWTSYDGPVDDAAIAALTETLRIDE